jgi:hypothetical protein
LARLAVSLYNILRLSRSSRTFELCIGSSTTDNGEHQDNTTVSKSHAMNEPDDDNNLVEVICEEGECVCSLHWDSGAPGSGAGVLSIYKFKNEY